MRYKSLRFFEKLIGQKRRFLVNYVLPKFEDIFYAEIKEVHENYLIVEQKYIRTDEEYNEEQITQKRKLDNGLFELLDIK
ncbi:hypothetical protein [Flavobacterium sp. UBA7680]|uniref:hypothetical protein n=1 Tax=Flavobacterium sp. UBA7680 TaxID=1946559 RepID=UPI0025BFFC81|nr:hypothetical protein [Flavobacterium sp. UBA7680]